MLFLFNLFFNIRNNISEATVIMISQNDFSDFPYNFFPTREFSFWLSAYHLEKKVFGSEAE